MATDATDEEFRRFLDTVDEHVERIPEWRHWQALHEIWLAAGHPAPRRCGCEGFLPRPDVSIRCVCGHIQNEHEDEQASWNLRFVAAR